ncbi:MAG: hypothetical protein GWP19_05170 [Planctomycetia bacterium]|nr:hypothetical protein [Planctomycetia bacterium]
MGRVWVENGLPPYVGAVENKTPGIFILNAISYTLFGTNIFFMRTIGIISLVLASLLIFKIGKHLHSYTAGVFAMIIFGLTMSWRDMDGAFASLTETFMILFTVLSFYIVAKNSKNKNWRYYTIFAGISMGIAIAFKQIAIITTAAIILYYIINNYKRGNIFGIVKGLFYICSGIIIGTAISMIPLWLSNVTINEYINGAWLILFDEGSTPSFINRFIFSRELWLESRLDFFYPFLFLLVFQQNLLKKPFFIGLLIWLIFDFIGVNASGYYFGHQIKQLMPSLSIIIGILIANSIQFYTDNVHEQAIYTKRILIFTIVFLLPYNLIFDDYIQYKSKIFLHQNRTVGRWLKDNSKSSDYLYFLCNANAVLSYSERVSSNKNFNPLFLNTDEEFEEVYIDLINKTPKFIVRRKFNKWNFPKKLEDFVEQNYSLNNAQYDFLIYERNQ